MILQDETVLTYAVKNQKNAAAGVLLFLGADPNKPNRKG